MTMRLGRSSLQVLVAVAALCAAPLALADRQQDPELGKLLQQALTSGACFEDEFDKQVWFVAMEPPLKTIVKDAQERADILHHVHCEARRLGLPPGPRDGSGRILVVEHEPQHPLGLLVDEASEVLRVPDGLLSPPPELANGPLGSSVRGVAKLEDRLVLLLDLGRVMGQDGAAAAGPGREAAV